MVGLSNTVPSCLIALALTRANEAAVCSTAVRAVCGALRHATLIGHHCFTLSLRPLAQRGGGTLTNVVALARGRPAEPEPGPSEELGVDLLPRWSLSKRPVRERRRVGQNIKIFSTAFKHKI
ncbi:hypothetical protein EVAR_6313_1 [Eumeta japonica]|uniref:Secreted protein n=1 Tax=Eumeta variegata TaxID=151549 RepID=A0A4C1TB14_EUMVA|nr:hypothetical protein EVAR_6313_1 [Eumeta japonica]